MATLTNNYRVLLNNIEPSEARKTTAQELPQALRDYLQKHEELQTVHPHTRLAGSYRRQTANGEIKDVDFLVFVSDEYIDDIEGLLKLLHQVLKDFPEEYGDCGPVTYRKQRRSIGIHLPDHDLYIDVVPVRLTTEKATDVLVVPDREWESWVKTQPLGYAERLSKINAEHGSKVVPLVKMFKHWRDRNFTLRRPKSYWLETMIVRHIECELVETTGKGYGEIVADMFDSIYAQYERMWKHGTGVPSVPDTMLGNNVAWNWERSHFETFMRRVEEAKGWARRAVNETDDTKAVELWQKIFGAEFPETVKANATVRGWEHGAAAKAGSSIVSAAGTVATAGVGVIAPATRFYGDSDQA